MGNPLGVKGLHKFHVLTSCIFYCYFIIIIVSLSSSFSVFFVRCIRVQTLSLGRYMGRSYFSDNTFLSMWPIPSNVIFSILLVVICVAWDSIGGLV